MAMSSEGINSGLYVNQFSPNAICLKCAVWFEWEMSPQYTYIFENLVLSWWWHLSKFGSWTWSITFLPKAVLQYLLNQILQLSIFNNKEYTTFQILLELHYIYGGKALLWWLRWEWLANLKYLHAWCGLF